MITRHITRRFAAVAGAAGIATVLAAGVASAAPTDGPGGSVSAAVTVPSTLVFTFTSGTSFTLAPGATAPAAVAWTISTNSVTGYTVSEAAPDLSNGAGATLPAGDLSETMHYSEKQDGTHTSNALALTNSAAIVAASNTVSGQAGNGLDSFAQDWAAASVPGNTPAGSYATTISYVAAAQ